MNSATFAIWFRPLGVTYVWDATAGVMVDATGLLRPEIRRPREMN